MPEVVISLLIYLYNENWINTLRDSILVNSSRPDVKLNSNDKNYKQ